MRRRRGKDLDLISTPIVTRNPHVHRTPGAASLIFKRGGAPPVRAFSADTFAPSQSVAVVVFTGAGDKAFCAGGDLQGGGASAGMRGVKGADKPPPTVTGAVRNLRTMMTSSQLLRESHFVSIAAVNGACAGAGLSWVRPFADPP